MGKVIEIKRTSEARCSSAEICRRNGWTPGTRLLGPRNGERRTIALQITAVGVTHVLGQEILEDASRSAEGQWDLTCRDWVEVLDQEAS